MCFELKQRNPQNLQTLKIFALYSIVAVILHKLESLYSVKNDTAANNVLEQTHLAWIEWCNVNNYWYVFQGTVFGWHHRVIYNIQLAWQVIFHSFISHSIKYLIFFILHLAYRTWHSLLLLYSGGCSVLLVHWTPWNLPSLELLHQNCFCGKSSSWSCLGHSDIWILVCFHDI